MLTVADGKQRAGWALQEARTGNINLAEICESEAAARELRRVMKIRQAHRGEWTVVPVLLTVDRSRAGSF